MKQGTIKTLGAAALGAAMATGAAGTAAAASPADTFAEIAGPQNMAVDHNVSALPDSVARGAGATQEVMEQAKAAEETTDPLSEVTGLLGGLPTQGLQVGDLAQLPTDQLPLGGLPL
ncbi:ATP-binding protein [Streptomyces gobiensis]|uniref:ATP-binding protein n=1 Tax=Streptomyces gobiensis TaxID=2875706 RepID=UPI001E63D9FC|nr:ATP-binding protein [Streptomyces gobiensis]UGY93287.1 ATP-binding protein [Streptomyces gobiensis]